MVHYSPIMNPSGSADHKSDFESVSNRRSEILGCNREEKEAQYSRWPPKLTLQMSKQARRVILWDRLSIGQCG